MKLVALYGTDSPALVDDADFDFISHYKWRLRDGTKTSTYAQTNFGKGTTLTMHRLILGAKKGEIVDHINHNGLDNRRENLRICTQQQNTWNRLRSADNTSGFIGVCFDKNKRKFVAGIKINKKRKFIGLYKTAEEAAKAYDEIAKSERGEFARLNFSL